MEVELEEECLKVLALHQPVAADLRFLVMVIKVNSDLERIGDHAVHIAERSLHLAREKAIPMPPDFPQMVQKVREMFRECLDALVNVDVGLARRICQEDDQVDAFLRDMFAHLQDLMRREPDTVERAIHSLSVCRNLERIADLATNVAEDVMFMAEGDIVRHQRG
jgi:phosphate transport system protein